MKKNNIYRIWVIAGLLVMTSLSLLAWTRFITPPVVVPVKPRVIEEEKEIVYDPALLEKLKMLAVKLDAGSQEFFLKGSYSYTDGRDSSATVAKADYVMCKKGQEFYCRFGDTETLNGRDIYVFADHAQKKIIVSSPKKVTTVQGMPDLGKLMTQLRGERYELVSGKDGEKEFIALINPQHISCKSYKLFYDPLELIPRKIEVIMNDPADPEQAAFDKHITLEMTQVVKSVESRFLTPSRLVRKGGAGWVPASSFKDYELIML